jgi:UDP-glucose-4-epimerase GalE
VILVTGGAGYIGSHTVKALKSAGFAPVIFDNFSTGHRSFLKDTPAFEGDLRNRADLEEAFRKFEIDGVLHFAGKALVGESSKEPDLYYETNFNGGLNLLKAMRNRGIRYFIFSSTCAIYGVPERVPIPEDHPQNPINPYGETKLAFERALRWMHEAYGIEYLSLRYFNAAGADADGEFGEDHEPETHLIPLALQAAAGRRPEVQIFGADYPTPDGTCIRDYIHVSDLAEAHVAGLQALIQGRVQSQAINLGTGHGHSVRKVIDTVRRITGRTFKARETGRRVGDPPELVAAADRAKELFGWTPVHSNLDEIVSSAWKWFQKGQ